MVRTLVRKSYPLLKVLLPLAALVLALGLYGFFTHTAPCTAERIESGEACTLGGTYADYPTGVLLPYVLGAALLALGSLAWRRSERYTLVFPTDSLQGRNRKDLENILEGLDQARAKGELTPERYTKARDRVLAEMGTSANPPAGKA